MEETRSALAGLLLQSSGARLCIGDYLRDVRTLFSRHSSYRELGRNKLPRVERRRSSPRNARIIFFRVR